MHWESHIVFSVISGVVLIAVGLFPGLTLRDRLWSIGGGAVFIAYGIYVAHQTSGTYFFPIWIYLVPFVGAFYIVATVLLNRGGSAPRVQGSSAVDEKMAVLTGIKFRGGRFAVLGVVLVGALAAGGFFVIRSHGSDGCPVNTDQVGKITGFGDLHVRKDGSHGFVCAYSDNGTSDSVVLISALEGSEYSGSVDTSNTKPEDCSRRRVGSARQAYVCIGETYGDARFGAPGWSCEVFLARPAENGDTFVALAGLVYDVRRDGTLCQ